MFDRHLHVIHYLFEPAYLPLLISNHAIFFKHLSVETLNLEFMILHLLPLPIKFIHLLIHLRDPCLNLLCLLREFEVRLLHLLSLFILMILKLLWRGRLFIFWGLYRDILELKLFRLFLFCLLDNVILITTYRLIWIKYNRLGFIRQSIFDLLLLFLLTLGWCPERVRHVLRFDFQYLLEILNKPNSLALRRRIIKRQLKLLLLFLFTILATN